ncbi:MAG: sugar ABC transporter permease [Oscillibacter sp.]|jgi:raffinose/stachyose/melibiose transport system permease protein|uniref:carbohydrate ABC transporter permease n=1 Tax=uncultured Oscillibacter sp. TaxID=876091 RepID=UPI0021708B68|nr:sugar ABC transporter permease [uncultured Oscillibacter sp.]MCI9644391.1 sugar ABC transporter permease [Oscillibacter sp.]
MGPTLYRRKGPLIVFLLPAFLFLILFLYYPFFQNILNSFSGITGLRAPAQGLNEPWYANYATLATDPKLRTALGNTVLLTLCTMVFQVGIALILALLVDSIRVGAQLFRTLYFFPIVISATALGLMFNLIFLYNGGMLNQLLANLGLAAEAIDWKDPRHFLFSMFAPVMWQYVGFYFVILVTGLNNISQNLYEAAALDGCTGWKRVRYVTLPLLRNVLCTCLVLAVTGALKVFDLPWVMFGAGMPQDQGWLTGTYMYDQTFNRGNVDYGSAIAILIVVLGVLFSNIANRVFRPRDDL